MDRLLNTAYYIKMSTANYPKVLFFYLEKYISTVHTVIPVPVPHESRLTIYNCHDSPIHFLINVLTHNLFLIYRNLCFKIFKIKTANDKEVAQHLTHLSKNIYVMVITLF